jgi:putative chitinase
MTTVTRKLLRAMGASDSDIAEYLPAFKAQLPLYGINTRVRVAHFLSQVFHESGCLRYDTENLNYSASALRRVFRKYFPTTELAEQYARKPRLIANRVYANRMGNGNEASGDGWKTRGRGPMQLTGKNNYTMFRAWLADQGVAKNNVLRSPNLVATDYGVHSAVFYWDTRIAGGLNRIADSDDCLRLTKLINGGKNGLEHRRGLLALAMEVL